MLHKCILILSHGESPWQYSESLGDYCAERELQADELISVFERETGNIVEEFWDRGEKGIWVVCETYVQCIYCNREIKLDSGAKSLSEIGPDWDDDEAWDIERNRHGAGCEWICTRGMSSEYEDWLVTTLEKHGDLSWQEIGDLLKFGGYAKRIASSGQGMLLALEDPHRFSNLLKGK